MQQAYFFYSGDKRNHAFQNQLMIPPDVREMVDRDIVDRDIVDEAVGYTGMTNDLLDGAPDRINSC